MWFLKIVHHIEILGKKNRNTKFRFCRRILDISGQWLLNDIANRCKKRFNHQNTAKIVVMWKPPIELIKCRQLQNATIFARSHHLLWNYVFLD